MESGAFDFWVGSWDCTWPGGRARNDVTAELDGRALLERFSSDDLDGLSLTFRDGGSGVWRQTWVDSTGLVLDFVEGTGDDGSIELRTLRDGVPHRMRWTDVVSDSLVWHWERQGDAGWDELWRIDYRRRNLDA